MNKKYWVAMTGLCVLMATSAAQAHLILMCVDPFASGAEVSTIAQACEPGALPVVGTKSSTRQKVHAEAVPYWSASAGAIGSYPQWDPWYSHAQGQPPEVAHGGGPDAGVQFAPAASVLMEASLDPARQFGRFASTGQASSSWRWVFDTAANRLGLTAAHAFHQGLGQRSSAAGNISGLPLQTSHQTFGQAPGPLAGPPNLASGNIIGNINGNIGLTPVGLTPGISLSPENIGLSPVDSGSAPAGGEHGHSIVDGISHNVPAIQVPEPNTLALLMVGLLGVAVTSRRRRKPAATG